MTSKAELGVLAICGVAVLILVPVVMYQDRSAIPLGTFCLIADIAVLRSVILLWKDYK
jgi:hypothetical protein